MKKSTIASVLILCGSTAALAQVVTPRGQPGTQNNTTANTTVDQPVTEPGVPDTDTNMTAPDNTTSNTPTPM